MKTNNIDLTDKYSCYSDTHGWHLERSYTSKIPDRKTGEYNESKELTHYKTLGQILNKVIDNECKECVDLIEIRAFLELAGSRDILINQVVKDLDNE
jgi:hypothetical protein